MLRAELIEPGEQACQQPTVECIELIRGVGEQELLAPSFMVGGHIVMRARLEPGQHAVLGRAKAYILLLGTSRR